MINYENCPYMFRTAIRCCEVRPLEDEGTSRVKSLVIDSLADCLIGEIADSLYITMASLV